LLQEPRLTRITAENHYTADYPEDEIDEDDEYGRNAYKYRTRNAADEEEYDVDGDGYEYDDDNDANEGPGDAEDKDDGDEMDVKDEFKSRVVRTQDGFRTRVGRGGLVTKHL
jgi:hypothetical protein